MRHAIGELMARSKRDIPQYYLATTIDLAAASAWLTDQNARRPVTERLLPAALLLKATASAARRVPGFNGFWRHGFQAAADGPSGRCRVPSGRRSHRPRHPRRRPTDPRRVDGCLA